MIYINDLPLTSPKLAFYLFVDDTNIYYKAENLAKLESVVNKELKKVKLWLDDDKLSLNIEKANFIIFKAPLHVSPGTASIKIGNCFVKQNFYAKFLGVF